MTLCPDDPLSRWPFLRMTVCSGDLMSWWPSVLMTLFLGDFLSWWPSFLVTLSLCPGDPLSWWPSVLVTLCPDDLLSWWPSSWWPCLRMTLCPDDSISWWLSVLVALFPSDSVLVSWWPSALVTLTLGLSDPLSWSPWVLVTLSLWPSVLVTRLRVDVTRSRRTPFVSIRKKDGKKERVQCLARCFYFRREIPGSTTHIVTSFAVARCSIDFINLHRLLFLTRGNSCMHQFVHGKVAGWTVKGNNYVVLSWSFVLKSCLPLTISRVLFERERRAHTHTHTHNQPPRDFIAIHRKESDKSVRWNHAEGMHFFSFLSVQR